MGGAENLYYIDLESIAVDFARCERARNMLPVASVLLAFSAVLVKSEGERMKASS